MACSSTSSSSSSPAIRILETVLVLPSSSEGPAPPETSLPLTFFDILMLQSPPAERVLFYRLAPDADVDAICSSLKTSLSRAIYTFYPLAGRIRLAPGTAEANRYEIYYRPGDGVMFTVAEYDRDVGDLATDDAREIATIAPLLPQLPEAGGLLALQATILTSGHRRGLAIGDIVHHAACDGVTLTHFLHTWVAAAFCTNAPGQEPPVIDRTLISDPRGLYNIFNPAKRTKFRKLSLDQLLATFVLSRDDLQRIKDTVSAEAARRGGEPPRCSSLVATLGLVWSCYLRAKKESSDSNGVNREEEGPTCLLFPVNHRSRMKPPLPEKYFGNCVGPGFAISCKAKLTQPGVGGLFVACAAVAAGIQEALAEIGTPRMDAWMERWWEAAAMSILLVGGSPRFRVYELDFGFGAPAKVDIVSTARSGALGLAESRRCDGGGVEVGVSLQRHGMDRFRKCFDEAVAWLRAGVDQ